MLEEGRDVCLRLGDEAPDFTADTSEETHIRFHEWKGDSWALLFSHPGDFTPVCTTELGRVAALKPAFDKRNVKVIALSVDPLETHYRWLNDIKALTGSEVNFPIIADPNRWIASLYGMIHPNARTGETVRATFVVGPTNKVELKMAYPDNTGRNFREILRAIDSLQLTAAHGVATPAEWKRGDDVLIPVGVAGEEAKERFPKGIDVRRPYFRVTPEPDR